MMTLRKASRREVSAAAPPWQSAGPASPTSDGRAEPIPGPGPAKRKRCPDLLKEKLNPGICSTMSQFQSLSMDLVRKPSGILELLKDVGEDVGVCVCLRPSVCLSLCGCGSVCARAYVSTCPSISLALSLCLCRPVSASGWVGGRALFQYVKLSEQSCPPVLP